MKVYAVYHFYTISAVTFLTWEICKYLVNDTTNRLYQKKATITYNIIL